MERLTSLFKNSYWPKAVGVDVPGDASQLAYATTAILAVLTIFVFFMRPSKAQITREVITKDRRSIEKYKGPVPQSVIKRALEAAVMAPNHFMSEPWRFRLIGKKGIDRLISLNEGRKELFAQ